MVIGSRQFTPVNDLSVIIISGNVNFIYIFLGIIEMEFVLSERGKPKHIHGNYIFVKQKRLATAIEVYECEE
jgi:hypothetical protein